MEIDEAIANIRKQINCECELYCRNYCSQCKDYVLQTQYVASIEKVIEYIEGRIKEKDWEKFMDAGKAALPKLHQVTNKDLIDFCNDMGESCEAKNCEYYEECNAYESIHGYIPLAEDTLHPERYTDEVIVIEESDEDGD